MMRQVEQVPTLKRDLPVANLAVSISLNNGTLLRSDTLRLQSFSGTESVSQPFVFNLEIRANDYTFGGPTDIFKSPNKELFDEGGGNFSGPTDGYPGYGDPLSDNSEFPTVKKLDFNEILGSVISVQLQVAEQAAVEETNRWVHFNGIVTSISLSDRGCYQIEMKPKMSLMGLQSHYRAYTDSTIVDVLETLLKGNGIEETGRSGQAAFEFNVSDSGLAKYRKQDWLQLGETDADFFNRLLEKAGLFYYFTHDHLNHTIVLTDTHYYQAMRESVENLTPGAQAPIKKLYLAYSTSGQEREDYITQFNYKQNLMPGVASVLVQKQSAWQSQNTAMVSPVFQDPSLVLGAQNIEELHTVAYGASKEELGLRTRILEKQLISAKLGLTGASSCPQLRCGSYFVLADSAYHRAADDDVFEGDAQPGRAELNGEEMVAISVTHHAEVEGKYSNQFEAVGRLGHGKAYQPHGDNSGNILAVVCDKDDARAPQRGRKFVEKSDFVSAATKTFNSHDSTFSAYSAKGVYVRLVTQAANEDPIWARLRDDTSTIPERGVYVTLGRSGDDTEMPEVQQILESKGNFNVMPEGYSVSASVGNSYSTNYGDSWRINLAADATTDLETAKNLVEKHSLTSNYNDVSFGESSSANVSLSPKSYSLSMTGKLPKGRTVHTESAFKGPEGPTPEWISKEKEKEIKWKDPEFDPDARDALAQHSQSINYGTGYSKNETFGAQTNKTISHGKDHSYTTQNEEQHSETMVYKNSVNKTTQNGIQYNTNYLASTEDYTLKGASNSMSITGVSNNYSIDGATFGVTAAVSTNSINMTGITTSITLEASTSFIKITGPGYQMENNAGTPTATLENLRIQMCLMNISI